MDADDGTETVLPYDDWVVGDDTSRVTFKAFKQHFLDLRQEQWDLGNFDNLSTPLREINAQLDAISDVGTSERTSEEGLGWGTAGGERESETVSEGGTDMCYVGGSESVSEIMSERLSERMSERLGGATHVERDEDGDGLHVRKKNAYRRLVDLALDLTLDEHLHRLRSNKGLEYEPLVISVLMCLLSFLDFVPFFIRKTPPLSAIARVDPLAQALRASSFREALMFTIGVAVPAIFSVSFILAKNVVVARNVSRWSVSGLGEIAICSAIFLLAIIIPFIIMYSWSQSDDFYTWRFRLEGFFICSCSFQLDIMGSVTVGLFLRSIEEDALLFLGKYSNCALLLVYVGRVVSSIEYSQANLGDESDYYTHAYVCAAFIGSAFILSIIINTTIARLIKNKAWLRGKRATRGELDDENKVPDNLFVVACMNFSVSATFILDLGIHLIFAAAGFTTSERAATFPSGIVNFHIYSKLLPIILIGYILPLWMMHKASSRTRRHLRKINKELTD